MKVKDGFMLRECGGYRMIVAIGKQAEKFHAMAHVNTSGAMIFTCLKNGDSVEKTANKLTETFNVDFAHAKADVEAYACKLVKTGIMEA